MICTECFHILQLENMQLMLISIYPAETITDLTCSGSPFFKIMFIICVGLYFPPRETKHIYK